MKKEIMRRLLLILTIGLIAVNLFSQTNCKTKNEYHKIFKIEKKKYEEREYLIQSVNEIDSNSCFSGLVNNNREYIDYLRTHFSDDSNYEKLLAISDTIELQNEFIKSLENDSLFNSEMEKLTKKITDKSNYVPDTVSMDELLNIAVKYFLIMEISEDGYYVGKVCTGINGLADTENERNPHVEAFCFSTIVNNYQGEQFNMYNEFVKGIQELYTIHLGIEDSDRLLRAQGAMYMFMRNNETLKELLLLEYENKKEYLPFVLNIK